MRQADAPPSARIQAIAVLLDRGWGKAVQPVAGDDDSLPRIVIRRVIDKEEPLLSTKRCDRSVPGDGPSWPNMPHLYPLLLQLDATTALKPMFIEHSCAAPYQKGERIEGAGFPLR
jgi:hypothetical protein